MPVEDIARRDVMTVRRDHSAGNLATVMKEEGVGSVIVESGGAPVGIVTDRDLVVAVLEPRRDPAEVTAGDVMTETLVTASLDEGIFSAIETMGDHAVRRLPVVDDDGDVAGIVTLDDFSVLLAEELDNLADIVEAESPPY